VFQDRLVIRMTGGVDELGVPDDALRSGGAKPQADGPVRFHPGGADGFVHHCTSPSSTALLLIPRKEHSEELAVPLLGVLKLKPAHDSDSVFHQAPVVGFACQNSGSLALFQPRNDDARIGR